VGLEYLTPRQREILGLVAKGLTNEDIGGVLGISAATVKTHITAVLATLDVSNRTEATSLLHALEARPEHVGAVLERPAIAVLPLLALDDDARARTVARAISHDLAALFACSCWFPVIAQVSADGARTLGPTSQHIARALGARFLVDGSLRTGVAADRGAASWRLVVRVDDAETGECLWTERYDFAESELFEVQDTVCAVIVATAYPVILKRVQLGLRRTPRTRDMAAWEMAHQGMEICQRREASLSDEARSRFALALERDPTLVLAHFGLGLSAYDDVLNQWGPAEAARARLLAAATRCIELAPHIGEGYFLQARYFQTRGDHARAVPVLETAIAKNPSYAQAHALLAQTLQLTGRSEEGLARMRHALRLGPRAFVAGLALLHFMRAEYHDALDHAESAVSFAPRYTFARVVAACAAHLIGDRPRAAEHMQRLIKDYPPFAPSRLLSSFGPEVDVVRRIGDALQALGMQA